jgi:hypothetical protein
MGRRYSLSFAATVITVEADLFELAPVFPIRLLGLIVSQTTEAGDAQDEMLPIRVIRGHDTSGSGGTGTLTPAKLNSTDAGCQINNAEVCNTTIASGGTPVTVHSDAFNVRAGYQLWWTPECAPIVSSADGRVVVRTGAPADSVSFTGTIYFEEIG